MAPSAHLITTTTTDIQDQVSLWFSRVVQAVADLLSDTQAHIFSWFSHLVQAVFDFLSGIWQSFIGFPKWLLHTIVSGLSEAGGFVLRVLARAGAFLLLLLLELLRWVVIILVTAAVVVLVVAALTKYFSREEDIYRRPQLLAPNQYSTNGYQTFSYRKTNTPSFPAISFKWLNFSRTETARPSTWSSTSGTAAGHRHRTEPESRTYWQTDDAAAREQQRVREQAAQKEQERLQKQEAEEAAGRERARAERERIQAERERRQRHQRQQAEEANRRKRAKAQDLTRKFEAWMKRSSGMTPEDMAKIQHIPDPPAVPLRCDETCKEAKAELRVAFCKHSMKDLIEAYITASNSNFKREELVKQLVRIWHPDNQKFIRSDRRVRKQAAEMTKILNGML